MIYSMPYVYSATVTQKRHTNPEKVYFGDHHLVEIRETTGQDAPAALRWQDTHYSAQKETRFFDDRHWVLVKKDAYAECLNLGNPFQFIFEAINYNDGRYAPFITHLDGKLRSFNASAFREVHEVRREQGIKSAEKGASNLLIIDGMIYRATREPRLYLHADSFVMEGNEGLTGEIEGRIWINNATWESAPYDTPVFKADRAQDAEDYFRNRFPEHRLEIRPFEILLPQSVNFEDEEDALRRTASLILGRRNKGVLSIPNGIYSSAFTYTEKMPIEYAMEWFKLRDAFDLKDNSEEVLGQIAQHLKGFGDGLQADRSDKETLIKKMIDDAVKRWDLRPMVETSFKL